MDMTSAKEQSRIYQRYQQIQETLQTASAESRVVQLVRSETQQRPAEKTQTKTTTSTDNQQAKHDANQTIKSQSPVHQSTVYQIIAGGKEYLRSAWLYRWLTKEPEPDVIVIDLRETRSVGPVLARIDRVLTALTPALLRSTVSRVWYRGQRQLQQRPIRTASFGAIAGVIMGLLVMTTIATVSVPAVLLLTAVLIGALRGTQSDMTLQECKQTRWYGYLQRIGQAFVPPEPPEQQEPTQQSSQSDKENISNNNN